MGYSENIRAWGREKLDFFFCEKRDSIECIGGSSRWNVETSCLDKSSIVYSAGVGRDISFERALVSRFGVEIELFDPSPTGIETMSLEENKVPSIHFFPIGIAGKRAERKFSPPEDRSEGSYRMQTAGDGGVVFPCADLRHLMEERGHTRIDLLKMDIEGFEYEIIEDLLRNSIDIKQICVEFHHFFEYIGVLDTARAILNLKRSGYSLIYKTRFDYTFLFDR